jgi:hypothetical protein
MSLMSTTFKYFVISAILILSDSCITQFIPETSKDLDLLVVEGMITDIPGQNLIKISTSMPLGKKSLAKPLSRCEVSISDDLGNTFSLQEADSGTYIANPSFHGAVGRSYTLHIHTHGTRMNLNYISTPVVMKPVPPIDNVYYEKRVLSQSFDGYPIAEGCQIYLDAHDPENKCKFYRWEYVETWEFSLPYQVPNKRCWVTSYSDKINIKNTSSYSESRVERQLLTYITNATDRLKTRYSILVKQYSINEEEYSYWEKLKNTVEDVGGLYDIIPASIQSNITCIERPDENVLGYFSVSSVSSKRIFINDQFRGVIDLYQDCLNAFADINADSIPYLNKYAWIIGSNQFVYYITYHRDCADCTSRGTTMQPDFW